MADPLGLIGSSGGVQPTLPLRRIGEQPSQQTPAFKELLLDNIKQVNDLQQDAEKAIEDLATGRRDDVANVMIAKQKADMAFKMLLQVRNKLVDAYQEIKEIRV